MSYRADKLWFDAHTDTHTQTQETTIPEGQNWPRVKIGFHCMSHSRHAYLSIPWARRPGSPVWRHSGTGPTRPVWRRVRAGASPGNPASCRLHCACHSQGTRHRGASHVGAPTSPCWDAGPHRESWECLVRFGTWSPRRTVLGSGFRGLCSHLLEKWYCIDSSHAIWTVV